LVRFLRILNIVDDVPDGRTDAPAFSLVQRH
jgi:hypothetical protein